MEEQMPKISSALKYTERRCEWNAPKQPGHMLVMTVEEAAVVLGKAKETMASLTLPSEEAAGSSSSALHDEAEYIDPLMTVNDEVDDHIDELEDLSAPMRAGNGGGGKRSYWKGSRASRGGGRRGGKGGGKGRPTSSDS